MVGHLLSVGLGHDLDVELPLREVALLDRLEEVALVRLAVLADEGGSLGVGEVLDALLRWWNLTQKRSPSAL